MEDTLAAGVVNDSLVTKQLEDFSESGTIDTLLSSGDIDTRTGLLNALVICFKPHGQTVFCKGNGSKKTKERKI